MNRIPHVQRLDQGGQIVGVRVHFVAVPGLARAPVTTPIVGDAAVPPRGEKHHLVFPGIRAQRPSVAEDHRLSPAPVLEVDLRVVFRRDRGHTMLSLVWK
jgi:hypothetical protein